MNFFNHNTSLETSLVAIGSTFAIESTVVVCLELYQVSQPPFKVNNNLYLDLLSFGSD